MSEIEEVTEGFRKLKIPKPAMIYPLTQFFDCSMIINEKEDL